jgi:hypothetical protein
MPLTDTECRTAKPKEKPYKFTVGNGFYLVVKHNGVKAGMALWVRSERRHWQEGRRVRDWGICNRA